MKYTKRLLKEPFEKAKLGLAYLKTLAEGDKAPVLFVKGDASDEFVDWFTKLYDDFEVMQRRDFDKHYNDISTKLVLVKGVKKLKDQTVDAAMACRNRNINVVISLSQHPKILDYVADPAFKLIEINDFNYAEIHEEVGKVRKRLT